MPKLDPLRAKRLNPVSLAVLVFTVSVLAIGCGDDGIKRVSGVVSYDGKPVTKGKVSFIPESGRPASGSIDSNGRYEMATSKDKVGVAPGEYTVTIRVADASVSGNDYATSNPKTVWIVPERYACAETTPLKATISSSGSNVIDFDIPAE